MADIASRMTPTLTAVALVDQVRRPECIETPGEMPKLEPRPMPHLPRSSASCGSRMPLWRPWDKLGD